MPTDQLYHHRRATNERAMAAGSATRMAQIIHVELARLHAVESDLLIQKAGALTPPAGVA